MDLVRISLESGARFPYDASDDWMESPGLPPAPEDWAHAAARGIVADMMDRRGIKWGFEEVDEETRIEIVERIAAIIRMAHKEK